MSNRQSSYTVIMNSILHKQKLLLKVLGLYCLIASLPDTWKFSLKGLSALNADGLVSIRSAVKTLEQQGLLQRVYERSDAGKLLHTKYLLNTDLGEKEKTFSMIPCDIFKNKSLSLKAKGLYCLIFSLPKDKWRFSITGLTKLCQDGKESISAAIKELEEASFLIRERVRDHIGQYVKSSYQVKGQARTVKQKEYSAPRQKTQRPPTTGNPLPDYPTTGNPMPGNRTLYNNKQTNTNKSNTNHSFLMDKFAFSEVQNEVRDEIEYSVFLDRYEQDIDLIDTVVDLIAETRISTKGHFTVNHCAYPKEIVIEKMRKLDFEQVEFALTSFKSRLQKTRIYNIKQYLFTCLFNAEQAMYFDQLLVCTKQ